MKFVTSTLLVSLCAFSVNILAADAPITKPETPRQQVPAAKGPALDLAIEAARVAIETCAADGGQKIAVSVVDSAGVLKLLLAAMVPPHAV